MSEMRKKKFNQFLLSNAFSALYYYTIWKYQDTFAHEYLIYTVGPKSPSPKMIYCNF